MKHLILALSLASGLMLAAPVAQAETPQERLVAALVEDGYQILQAERTWLGRLRIVAIKGDLRREVVINPGTGEVLRDIAYAEPARDSSDSAQSVASSSGGGSGSSTSSSTVTTLGTGVSSVLSTDGSAAAVDGSSLDAARDLLLPESAVSQ